MSAVTIGPAVMIGSRPAPADPRAVPVRRADLVDRANVEVGRPHVVGAAASRSAQRQQAPLRLTRRGRLAVTLLVSLVALVVGLLGARTALASPTAASTASGAGTTAVDQVTVLPGDTLWSIAHEVGVSGDVRDRIAQIRSLNDLETSALAVGQELIVPVP